MLKLTRLLALCLLVRTIRASPFELTEKYVKEFQEGVDRLIEVSKNTVLAEESYKPEQYDEEAALKSK